MLPRSDFVLSFNPRLRWLRESFELDVPVAIILHIRKRHLQSNGIC